MAWIRNPWWDSFWILSGIPVAIILLFMPPVVLLYFFAVAVLLETGHNLSPIVLAWSHTGLRRIALTNPGKFLIWPLLIFAASLGIGWITSLGMTSYTAGHGQQWRPTDWSNPFPLLVWTYWIWQIYHFGMQNFGVLQLYKRKILRSSRQRNLDKYSCLIATSLGMVAVPLLVPSFTINLICFGVISFNHWMVSIGLCSAISRRTWLFILAILLLGFVGFIWEIPTSHGTLIRVIPLVVGARIGLGFVHFLYDRWIWKLSDPQVRAAIGQGLSRTKGRAKEIVA